MVKRRRKEIMMLPPTVRRLVRAIFIPVLMLTAASAGAQPGMTNVRYLVLFHQRCAACHGLDRAAPRAASLEALRVLARTRVRGGPRGAWR